MASSTRRILIVGGRKREPGAGFKFFCWDSERSLGGPGSPDNTKNITGVNTSNHPSELHQYLTANAEYRMRFADRVQKHCFNGGPLTPESCAARYTARATEIRPSLISESARWGDRWRPTNPHTPDNDWRIEFFSLIRTYFPGRTDNLITQLRGRNLFPAINAPSFTPHGGYVTAGLTLPFGDRRLGQ